MARLEKQENLLRLCMQMQANADGVSLQNIEQTYNVSRRTAERMRDAVLSVFPQVEEVTEGRTKRWRMPPTTLGRMNDPSVEELSALNRGVELSLARGDHNTAEILSHLQSKLRANINRRSQLRIEPDLMALLEADYVALRPGPREKIPDIILGVIRTAIISANLIIVDHVNRATGELKTNIELGPLGLLMGNGRQYLVAWNKNTGTIRHYALSGIENIRASNTAFERPKDFKLSEFMSLGFGLFHGEIKHIEWRFKPAFADLASRYEFHPHQEIHWNEDGSLTVSFQSSGFREMVWHLFQWGDQVEIVSPPELKKEFLRQLNQLNIHYAKDLPTSNEAY